MKSRTNFLALEREFKQNETTIKKLQNRNLKISALFKLANELSGGTPLRSNALKGELQAGGLKAKVMDAMNGGVAMPIADVALAVFEHKPTQEDIDKVSNACSGLRKQGKLSRLKRGVYRSNFPVKQTKTIGSDTRVTQIPPKKEKPSPTAEV